MWMSDGPVTANAARRSIGMAGIDCIGNIPMAIPAAILGDFKIVRFDDDGFAKTAGRERPGMSDTVGKLCKVFAGKMIRGVAVVANRGLAMTGRNPTRELLAHDVAVGAGRGTISQIRSALGVNKGKAGDADRHAYSDTEKD